MKKTFALYLTLFTTFIFSDLSSQTANVTKGCIPLSINFSSPTLNNYYWDFKDGGNSSDQNPQHIFTRAGIYAIDLFEGKNGRLVGSINIKVFADPILQFTATNTSGCSPLTTKFSSQVQIDPEINITSVLWSFGDGNSSIQMNPSHTYLNAGTYNVSFAITTNYGECNKTELISNYIVVKGVKADFKVSSPINCETPSTISITNNTISDPTYTYNWDFGNGTNFVGHDPKTVTYLTQGSFTITLKVKDKSGCESVFSVPVSVGKPSIEFSFNDSVCFDKFTKFSITSAANNFIWNFGSSASPQFSNIKNPSIRFTKNGIQRITLSAISGTCRTDTSFSIYVEQIDTNFTISTPDCKKNPTITLTANNYSNYSYIWNDSIQDDFQLIYNYNTPKRDSFYRHRSDTVVQKLFIRTTLGCIDSATKYFVQRSPDAIMIPSNHEGCAPLNVSFKDTSLSINPIIRWTILFGDGQEKTFNNNQLGSHTYSSPGVYFLKLIIENSKNCIDTSEGFYIKVGEKLDPTFIVDKTEICLGETITVTKTNSDPRIDTWHINSDNGRFNHCWKNNSVTHRFINNPGTFPLSATGEYNGCASESTIQTIKVKGAKPNLHYMIDCTMPNDVMFSHSSIGANKIKWEFGDTTSSQKDSLIHHYKKSGTYTVTLIAEDSTSGCIALKDMRRVHIRNIKAELLMEDTTCAGTKLVLDGKKSIDVDSDCYTGYLWKLPDHRPRTNNKDTIQHSFGNPGFQEVTLVTTDINGCQDSMTKKIYVSTIQAGFVPDKDNVCFPADVQFTDKSISNNKITKWDWSFGDTIPNPKHQFKKGDRNLIILKVTNELNCSDSTIFNLRTYTPFTKIEFNKGPGICIGDTIQFFAKDYTTYGSYLNFNWDFGTYGTSNMQNPKITFNSNDRIKVRLLYTEDSSGCSGADSLNLAIVNRPDASFTVPLDTPYCYPHIFQFNNTSYSDSTVLYFWEFEPNKTSVLKNPTYAYGKGTFTTKLFVKSIFGCQDSTSQTFTLIGPEGNISSSAPFACKGDPITFSAQNLVDVGSIQWEFNDGNPPIKDQNKVEHTFDNFGKQTVVLILKSAESNCEFIDSINIEVPFVKADFENIDTLSYCPGIVILRNLSQPLDSNNYKWEFGDNKPLDSSIHPITTYKSIGRKNITLSAINKNTGCIDRITKEINIEEVQDFLTFPNVFSPNNDGVNDYFTVAVKKQFKDVVKVTTLKVYNRWGKLIYDNQNPNLGWDGSFEGVESPVEVYAYYMEVEIKDCNTKSKKGNVTIVR